MSNASVARSAPELLAPAGNWECVHAAIENGADAIYFGLEAGFNARARATNFALDDLPRLMQLLHRRGLAGYVTLNTLVFTDELNAFEQHVAHIAQSGVDAVLVQDLGAVRLIHEICPELSVHASTQMTMVSAEAIATIESLGIDRVVLARELSLKEIRKITEATSMPVETFVHGALCVAYSGQCLTSESLGGRSANRGQCAQACRLDYELICDGKTLDLGDVKYLLSPQDLAAYEHIPDLIDAGVCSLKIEGRLKSPEYVANIVHHYRQAIDDAMKGIRASFTSDSKRDMELSFSRGFSPGWLEGCDHKRLVPGKSSAKRGVQAGSVIKQKGEKVVVDLTSPLGKGDGVVFEGNRSEGQEMGGRIFEVLVNHRPTDDAVTGRVELLFQRGLFQGTELHSGQSIWQTDAPKLTKRLRQTFATEHFLRKIPVQAKARVAVGEPIRMEVSWTERRANDYASVQTLVIELNFCPDVARKHELNVDGLRNQLARLGNTPYELQDCQLETIGQPMVPLSVLGDLRHRLVKELDHVRSTSRNRAVAEHGVAQRILRGIEQPHVEKEQLGQPRESHSVLLEPGLSVLCRTRNQVDQVLEAGERSIYAEFQDIREYREAVAVAHAVGAKIFLATLRILKPGEMGLFRALAKHQPDGLLVRNVAGLKFASEHQIPCIADFSLNVTNPLSAQWLVSNGASRITASYDLNRDQLNELIVACPRDWLEVVIHQHMPMFHMEHCVYCTVLSPGTNKSNCGRPCDRHDVRLRDRIGVEHVLHADIGCRNTLFNGNAQSGAEAVERLLASGVRNYRIELLRDASTEETARLLGLYRDLLAGRRDGGSVWRALKAENRVGVTRGTLEHPRNPLAIL